MGRLGVLVICVVAGGVLFFALSLRSAKTPAEGDLLASPHKRDAAARYSEGDRRGDSSSPEPGTRRGAARQDGAQSRRASRSNEARFAALPRKKDGRMADTSSGTTDSRRQLSAEQRSAGLTSAPGNPRAGYQTERRGKLVDFLASQERRGSGGTDATGSGSEIAGDETIPGEPEADEDGVLLSVPLAGAAEAEGDGYTQPIAEENLHPSEEGDGIEFPTDSVLAFPDAGNIQGEAGSIQLEIEPNWSGSEPGDNSFVQVRSSDMWQGRVSIYRNSTYLRFVWFDNDGVENGVSVPIDSWAPGERHAVTATWGEALMSLYVDGRLAGQNTYSGQLSIPPGTPLFIGSNPRHHVPGADAKLSNFKVFGRALAPDEVAGP